MESRINKELISSIRKAAAEQAAAPK